MTENAWSVKSWEMFGLRVVMPLLTVATVALVAMVIRHEGQIGVIIATGYTDIEAAILAREMRVDLEILRTELVEADREGTRNNATLIARVDGLITRIERLESR